MYLKHLSSLQFLSYAAFLGVVIAAVFRLMPGKAPPLRTEPYSEEELARHDKKLAKYFVGGAAFLVLGSVHMIVKNVPWAAEWLARAGYAGHLVRDLANTHLMIVGGGTLMATGLCWYVLPRIVGRPLASEGLAQGAFWFTAAGLLAFYVAFVGNGIAIGIKVSHGWDYPAAKASMGNWYKAPVGMGAGIMGLGYWCFAVTVFLTVFQARLVRVPKPSGHLWKFIATGAAGLTVGTVQGVIQVQPANADWLYRAGHAGEWIDPIAHAHINLVTGLTMLVAGALFYLAPMFGGKAPSRRVADRCFYALLAGSLAFYASALYLGFHEGALVLHRGLSPSQAEAATRVHPFLLMSAGIAMMGAFWFLLALVARSYRGAQWPTRGFVLAGCAALAVGTLQGPIQAFPAVHDLLERGGDAGSVIVNLHAQLNMLGGLLVMLAGLTLALLTRLGGLRVPKLERLTLLCVPIGVATYYVAGIEIYATEAHDVSGGASFHAAVARLEPWSAFLLIPAALAVLRRIRRVCDHRLADDCAAATRRCALDRAGPAGVHGEDPAARAEAQPRGPRRLRASDGPARLSRSGVALRRLPGDRVDSSALRPCVDVGRDPDRVLAVRAGTAHPGRVEDRARVATDQRGSLRRFPLPGPLQAPCRPARDSSSPAPLPWEELSHPGQRRRGVDRAPARLLAVRPCGRRSGRELDQIHLPASPYA